MTGRGAAAAVALALAGACAGGCVARDTIAADGDAGVDLGAYCADPAAAAVLVDGTCAGALAEDVFRHAVCACQALSLPGDAATDGFDSRVAPYAPGGGGAALASRLEIDLAGGAVIGGDLIAGAGGIEAGATLDVAGDLVTSGGLGRSSSAITVAGAAQIGGAVDVATLDVGGTLTTAPGATLAGAITAGAQQTAAVAVPPPCRCEEAVDVAAIVLDHALSNHDAELGLAPDALRAVAGDATLELPCGRFYLDGVVGSGAGTITLRATGRALLVIDGDVTAAQTLAIELAEDAELDLFVGGTIQVGGLRLGDPARPRALRIYVGAAGSINVPAGSTIAANLHAPRADLAISPPSTELYGALVVARVAGGGALTFHHDRAIPDAAAACR